MMLWVRWEYYRITATCAHYKERTGAEARTIKWTEKVDWSSEGITSGISIASSFVFFPCEQKHFSLLNDELNANLIIMRPKEGVCHNWKLTSCWCLGGDCRGLVRVHTGSSYYHTWQHAATVLTCMQVTAINAAKLCVLQQAMYTEDSMRGNWKIRKAGTTETENGNGINLHYM